MVVQNEVIWFIQRLLLRHQKSPPPSVLLPLQFDLEDLGEIHNGFGGEWRQNVVQAMTLIQTNGDKCSASINYTICNPNSYMTIPTELLLYTQIYLCRDSVFISGSNKVWSIETAHEEHSHLKKMNRRTSPSFHVVTRVSVLSRL